jgi:hypothetical protein
MKTVEPHLAADAIASRDHRQNVRCVTDGAAGNDWLGSPGKRHIYAMFRAYELTIGLCPHGGKCPASPDITALALPIPRVIDRFTFSGWADQGSRVP